MFQQTDLELGWWRCNDDDDVQIDNYSSIGQHRLEQ